MRDLIRDILARRRRAIARAISLVEAEPEAAQRLLAQLYKRTGHAHLIGVTGAPGTGKSTLVNALIGSYRAHGITVGIIAVDPTSPFTGGALLGDRVRMTEHSGDSGVFIRSMASRGQLGGLARATDAAVQILDAAGYDKVIVETVGAGQAEVEIAKSVDTTVVLQVPNLGDDIQAIKAGQLEIADILVVNKADREGADRLLHMLLGMIESASVADWQPPVLKTVATQGNGIDALQAALKEHKSYLRSTSTGRKHRRDRVKATLQRLVQAALMQRFTNKVSATSFNELVDQVSRYELEPGAAVDQLLRAYDQPDGGQNDPGR